ncbi:MAG: transposase [Bdellovibrionota bacterium]
MTRKILERSQNYPYHTYNRTIDKTFFNCDLKHLWNECMNLCCILSWAYGARIHAFVLMSNHFHMLISTPDENIDDCMRYFQGELSRWVASQIKSQRNCFGARYKWTIIKDALHYRDAYKYVYQNPIRAKLCLEAEKYPFSTLSGRLGNQKLSCPIYEHEFHTYLPTLTHDECQWINTVFNEVELGKIRSAVKKRIYATPLRVRKTFRPTMSGESIQVCGEKS